nr:helix-turn-helix transcriptional regulator [Blautia coccoides]
MKGGDIVGIGTKLERLLKERNMNANELAQKINVAPTTIYSMIRRDSKKADIEVLFKLSKELGVDAEYFCDNDEDISRHEPSYDDVERLIARNGKQMSKEQKLRLIQLLSEIVE